MRETVSYSEAFKRGVVEKAALGKYAPLAEAGRRNGIKGNETLVRWIKKYGREDVLLKKIKAEAVKEIDGLKAAPAGAHMDRCLESAFLDIARGRPGTAAEDLKKKNAITLAGARKRRGRQ
jgi:transposase-like protein